MPPPNKLWIDVEDLFDYALRNPRPSGIQRIEYELCRAFAALDPEGRFVRFVRHAPTRQSFYVVPWEQLSVLFAALSTGSPDAAEPARCRLTADASEPDPAPSVGRGALRRAARRLPLNLRAPLLDMNLHLRGVARSLRELGSVGASGIARRLRRATPPPAPSLDAPLSEAPEILSRTESFARSAGPGDFLVVLGSPWSCADYAAYVEKARRRHGMRFAMLMYDIIPLRRPEWCDEGLIRVFGDWVRSVLPLTDVLMTISQASAADIASYAYESGISLREPPRPIPIGTGFQPADGRRVAGRAEAPRLRQPLPERYALIVSTIEARKNHALLFRVWRRLLADLPAGTVPTLVFAGRVGWLVSDLMKQLHNSRFLDGKVILVEDPTDDELETLYKSCLFTLFPSFYEGWGLPVTESYGFGRPCIMSNATSLPEAGGELGRYFDPDNATEAYQVIRDVIERPDEIRSWQERVAREFRPVSWDESAQAVLRRIGLPQTADPRTDVELA